ncbi:uncharacterized protein LOC124918104 [Impatiens glandulifera]|uniref:uncharacterized protein LOC124918104 n=1 Tax=Impatiens glandulifera TaxID=253017 RepID=UPI001FB06600|nr:uncharacterized protein LOC124918104 [Impatiens glandulifera]
MELPIRKGNLDEPCTYTEIQFRRRFRMRRKLFLRIVEAVTNYNHYFTQRRNNAGKLGLTPIHKCTVAMRMLAYGVAGDACDEYVIIGETTTLECTRQFTNGHKGTSTIILEAVASYDLWIWHAFYGMPGTLNNINVLDRSSISDDIESGEAPAVNFTVNGRQYNLAYYLADEIYPKWSIFVQSIQIPQGDKVQLFAKQQEV